MRLPLSSLIRRYRRWSAQNLANRISGTTLLITTLVGLLVATATYVLVHRLLVKEVEASLRAASVLATADFADHLQDLAAETRTLARRSVVTNALVDSQGLSGYLSPFMRETLESNPGIVGVELSNHRGETILRSGTESLFADERPAAYVATVNTSQARTLIRRLGDKVRLLYIAPVIYPHTNTVEGALSIEVDVGRLFTSSLGHIEDGYNSLLLDSAGNELSHVGTPIGLAGRTLDVPVRISFPELDPGLHISVEVGLQAYWPLASVLLGYCLLGLLMLWLARELSTREAERITRRLRMLSGIAQEIAAGAITSPRPIEIGGVDEIATLGRAFNRMLAALGAAREHLESEVDKRTRELAETQKRLAGILDSMQDVVYSLSLDMRELLYIGPALRELAGLEGYNAPITLKLVRSLIHPDDRESLRLAMEKVHQNGFGELRYRLLCPDDRIRWVHDRFHLVFDAAGSATHIDGIVTDITGQVLAEQARDAAEAMLHLKERALQASSNGIIITDMKAPGQPIIYLNPAFERITGYTQAETLGHTCSLLQGKERDQPELEALRRAIAVGTDCQVVLRNYRKDGRMFWNELSISPVRDPASGKVTHYVGIQNDITLRRETEQQLFEWFLRFDTIFTLSPDGFVSFDANDRVAFVNPAFERMTGKHAGALTGLPMAEFDAQISALCDPAQPYPSCGEATAAEQLIHTSERRRSPRTTLNLLQPQPRVLQRSVRHCDSEVATTVFYFRDVTRETEVDRMKSEFLSTAAHELRTPMASIMGFSELLLIRKYDEAQTRDLLETINRQAGRLTNLLNELLDLARIEARAGKDFRMARQAIVPVIEDTLAALMVPGDEREVVVRLQERLPEVNIDSSKMQQ
ncbi:MAG: PAS domain S-box protein, partial [Zoogloea sp.]|nr:PAS domain S-box protein [Zoogloea sp.]